MLTLKVLILSIYVSKLLYIGSKGKINKDTFAAFLFNLLNIVFIADQFTFYCLALRVSFTSGLPVVPQSNNEEVGSKPRVQVTIQPVKVEKVYIHAP